jgi:N,N-dimethylformamidase
MLNHGAAGDEVDRLDFGLGTPPHALLLATSAGRHTKAYHHVIEEMFTTDSSQHGEVNEFVRSDVVFFETPKGGAVFSTGSINWCGVLSYDEYNNDISVITDNVVTRFASDEPLPPIPG